MIALIALVILGICLMVLERIFPAQPLPKVPGWWGRVLVINILQLGAVLLAGHAWETWLGQASPIRLGESIGSPAVEGLVAYLVITFVFYWWHRLRHDLPVLWVLFHQIHHSPQRIETITSFFKHPLEILVNSLIISSIAYALLGLSPEGGAWVTAFTGTAEFFYHMNIATPRWVGRFIQRPEMHRLHHQRGVHYGNFADIPLWDKLFGTYRNPQTAERPCGFKPEREAKFFRMLFFANVNGPVPAREKHDA